MIIPLSGTFEDIMVGDHLTMYVSNLTRWNRLLFWLFKRPIPDKLQKYKVTHKYSGEVEIDPLVK